MPAIPVELTELLSAPNAMVRSHAWDQLITRHSRLVLHVARSLGGGHDRVMDRYAYILEHLQEDDCRRLRAFRADGPAQFSTWLAVVARRLCYDQHRESFGRQRGEPDLDDRHRHALGDLSRLEGEASLAALPAAVNLESEFESAERSSALAAAVERLEPADRLILHLRFTDELSALEISRIIGAPTPFHVYRRINRILAMLREWIDRPSEPRAVDG